MIIKCFRDGKEIDSPNDKNADYIIANDTVVSELRDTFIALKHNKATRVKRAKILKEHDELKGVEDESLPTEEYYRSKFTDNEYDAVEVSDVDTARLLGDDLIKVVVQQRTKDIQKTGIICPECYLPTDFVIWGVHKNEGT